MNQDQILSIVRWVITAVSGFFVTRGWITSEQTEMLVGVAVALVPLAWSIFLVHTAKGKVNAAKDVQGVTVVVGQEAPDSVKTLAESTAPENANVQMSKITLTSKGKVA